MPSTRAYTTSPKSIAPSTVAPYVAVPFDATRWDDEAMWSAAAPTRLTATVTGIYIVTASAAIAASGLWLGISVNSILVALEPMTANTAEVSSMWTLPAGSVVEMRIAQNNAVAQNTVVANNYSCELSAARVPNVA